jgi:hypothetical protein
VDAYLNDVPVGRVHVNQETTARLALPPPSLRAMPSVVTLVHGHGRPPTALDAAHRIGTTGVLFPGDLVLTGASFDLDKSERNVSIRLNEIELAPNQRGYNVVALDSTGRRVGTAVFDTYDSKGASAELAAWVGALPPRTIVVGAVRDEASRFLDESGVQALRTLGVAGDLRGHVREVHLFVGVKGALPGSALERLGRPTARLIIGYPDPERGVELTGFELIRPGE